MLPTVLMCVCVCSHPPDAVFIRALAEADVKPKPKAPGGK